MSHATVHSASTSFADSLGCIALHYASTREEGGALPEQENVNEPSPKQSSEYRRGFISLSFLLPLLLFPPLYVCPVKPFKWQNYVNREITTQKKKKQKVNFNFHFRGDWANLSNYNCCWRINP